MVSHPNGGANAIEVNGTGNLIVKNTVSGNWAAGYVIAPGNAWGTIVNVAGIGAFFTNEPWANFEY